MASSVSRRLALLLPLILALAGCDMSVGDLTGRATDEWTHRYSLSPGGEVRIVNTNGTIDVEGVEGADLEVRAERVARAATDTGAAELLPRISIKEDVTPDRVWPLSARSAVTHSRSLPRLISIRNVARPMASSMTAL